MKKENGISRINLIIIIGVIIIIGCLIAGIAVGLNNRKNKQREMEEKINAQMQEAQQQNQQQQANQIKKEEEKVEPFEFTKEFLKTGKTFGQVEIIDNRLDGTTILSITGVADNDVDQTNYISTKNRWYTTIDLTKYKTLEVYCRRGKDNGDMIICIDNIMIKRVRYTELPTAWTKYYIDISEYKGEHTLALAGGYADRSGSENSNTQYCNIKLK